VTKSRATLSAIAITAALTSTQALGQGKGGLPDSLNVNVTNIDNTATQAFQAVLCQQFQFVPRDDCGSVPSSYLVAANRRLVIEYVSGRCPPSGTIIRSTENWSVQLETTVSGVTAKHTVFAKPAVSIGAAPQTVSTLDVNGFDVAQLTRIYADGGTQVKLAVHIVMVNDHNFSCHITITGYSIPL
jgi:hypothetical protein